MNLILMNCVLGGSDGMRGKSLLNENTIIILSLNQSEWRKLLRSASSRIGFSLDTGIEERACRSSCRPLFLAIRKRSSKDLFSLCFLLDRPLRRTPWDRRFLRTFWFQRDVNVGTNWWYMYIRLSAQVWRLWRNKNGIKQRIKPL